MSDSIRTIQVHTRPAYTVSIGSGLLSQCGQQLRDVLPLCHVAVITDSTVAPLYLETAKQSLLTAGFTVSAYVFPAGEAHKNLETLSGILEFLAEAHLTRTDCVAALGGGVTGDMAGFAAACYLRGIRCVQLPTTLLSAVDSSVGGKTAIDLPAGKNLAGTFYQPRLVLCDTDVLSTLPPEIFRDGCAEVIKYGILYDRAFFDYLRSTGPEFDRERVIRRCVELKRDVVAKDEFDTGARMKLNLGHTVGHGVEARSRFAVSHGRAVAIGIAIVSRAAAQSGMLSPSDAQAIVSTLDAYGLPIATEFSARELAHYMLSDKKRSGGTVSLIIPRAIGCCDIVPTPVEALEDFVEAGL